MNLLGLARDEQHPWVSVFSTGRALYRWPQRLAAPLLAAMITLTGLVNVLAQTGLPRVGIVTVGAAAETANTGRRLDLIRNALAARGWVDGDTVILEMRNALGNPARFAQFADDLVRRKVDVIWADSAPAVRAAYAATRTIPIVAWDFTTNPVAAGYAQSFAKPGGNVTGVFLDAPEFSGKWLELLKTIVPGLSRVAVLWDPVAGDTHVRALQSIAHTLDLRLRIVEVRRPQEIEGAAPRLRSGAQAVIILPSPMMSAESARLARLMARVRLPATSIFRSFAEAGGAIAYGPDQDVLAERVASIVTRVLRGAKPAELPIEQPTKFDLFINLSTVTALGLSVPDSLLARADKVIR
jgi:putative tryptophan/tyrosine transport system substrate-binding protein